MLLAIPLTTNGFPQSPPEVSGKVSEPPKPASPPQKGPDTDAQAVPEAAELEQAAAATLVGDPLLSWGQAGMLHPWKCLA